MTSYRKSLSQNLLVYLLRALVWLLGYTLLRVNHFYGTLVGRFLWWFDTTPKRTSRANIALAFPEMSESERESLVKANLFELGKTLTELGPIWNCSRKRFAGLIAEVKGKELLDEAYAEGRGVIVLVPHFGCWELVGLFLSIEYQITSLYSRPRLHTIDRFMRSARERFGAKLVPADMSGVRALRRALRKGEMLGILPDQDPKESGGIRAPFFGHYARTMLLVSRLAARSNCRLAFCVAERLPNGKGYCIHIRDADTAIASKDDMTAATALNKGVEACARINPSQYQWTYMRFKESTPVESEQVSDTIALKKEQDVNSAVEPNARRAA